MSNKVPGIDLVLQVLSRAEFGVRNGGYNGSTRSFWHDSICPQEELKPCLDDDLDCDLLIIGGGFTGLSAARFFSETGMKICLVEREFVGFGASGRNTGYCNNQIGDNRLDEANRDQIKHLYSLGCSATDHVLELIEKYEIKCDVQNHGFAYVATNDAHLKVFERYKMVASTIPEAAQNILYWGDSATAKSKTGCPLAKAVVYDKRGFNFNPFKFARGLLNQEVANNSSIRVFEQTGIEDLRLGATGSQSYKVTAFTNRGKRIRANHCVFACNAYSSLLGIEPFDKVGVPLHVHTVASQRLEDDDFSKLLEWGNKPFGWYSFHNILWAIRATPDQRLVVATGIVEHYADDWLHQTSNSDIVYKSLLEGMNSFFPQFENKLRCESKWEGVIFMSANSNPVVGTLPQHPYLMFSLAYCGHGVSFSNYSGLILRDIFQQNRSIPNLPFGNFVSLHVAKIPRGNLRNWILRLILDVLHRSDRLQDARTLSGYLCSDSNTAGFLYSCLVDVLARFV